MFTEEEQIAHLEEDLASLRKTIMQAKGVDVRSYQRPAPGGTPVLVRAMKDIKDTLTQGLTKIDVAESDRIATKLQEKEKTSAK